MKESRILLLFVPRQSGGMERTMQKKEFYKKLIQFVLPIAFQQFMLALVSTSDAMMLGRFSQNSLSAVALASQVTFVYNLFLAAMTIGTNIFAAQYWGKKDKQSVEKVLGIALRISVTISFIFAAVTMAAPNVLMRIFTGDAALIAGGVVYLRIVSVTYFLCGISQIYLCIMKNSDHQTESMVISVATVLINIALNAILIFGLFGMPKMEIAGAAVATTIAGIFCAGGDSKFGFLCDTVTMWCVTVPLGMLAAFVWKLPVVVVYFIVNLDEIVKLPAVYLHYKKYRWVKNLTV